MRRELKKIKAENAALAQRVQAGRENIARTQQQVSTTVDEWKVRKKTRNFKCKCVWGKKIPHIYIYISLLMRKII